MRIVAAKSLVIAVAKSFVAYSSSKEPWNVAAAKSFVAHSARAKGFVPYSGANLSLVAHSAREKSLVAYSSRKEPCTVQQQKANNPQSHGKVNVNIFFNGSE